MKKLIAIVFPILVIGCNQNKFITFRLSNFKDTSIYFRSTPLNPTLLEVSVSGNSDNSFIINNIKLPCGKLDTLIKMDWYRDTVIINLKSYKATEVNLILKCKKY